MKPLQSVAMGLVIVGASARVNGWDLLPDPLGWLLVLAGLAGLPRTLPHREAIRALAVLAAVVSVPLWVRGVPDAVADVDESLLWAMNLPQLAFVALLCQSLATGAAQASDGHAARWLGAARTGAIVAALLPVGVFATGWPTPVAAFLVGLATLVLTIVLLFRYSDRPWGRPQAVGEVDQTASS